MAKTIAMCQLRTVSGLKVADLKAFMDDQKIETFLTDLSKSTVFKQGFVTYDQEIIRLEPSKAFIVSNAVIADVMQLIRNCF